MEPMGVIMADNKLYVCDMGNKCICVFTTEGESLTYIMQSARSQRTKQRQIKDPVGIHVTEERGIYVF